MDGEYKQRVKIFFTNRVVTVACSFRNLWQWKPHIFESNRCWPHVTPVVSISLTRTRRGVIYRRLLEHDDPIE